MKTLHLSKENLKFSAAHFLILDNAQAERLHGHNYQVQIDFMWKQLPDQQLGFCVNFKDLKTLVRDELTKWDEYLLLPKKCSEMQFVEKDESLHLHFRNRYYVFPRDEVVLLPIVNTSVELLSELLCEQIWSQSHKYGFAGLKVYVEETRGQGAWSSQGENF